MTTLNEVVLMKFVLELSAVAHPLYEPQKGKAEWTWWPAQWEAFRKVKTVKTAVTTALVLSFYDVNKPTVVSAATDSVVFFSGGALEACGLLFQTVQRCPEEHMCEKECLASVCVSVLTDTYMVLTVLG